MAEVAFYFHELNLWLSTLVIWLTCFFLRKLRCLNNTLKYLASSTTHEPLLSTDNLEKILFSSAKQNKLVDGIKLC